jgi:hypothetical protein
VGFVHKRLASLWGFALERISCLGHQVDRQLVRRSCQTPGRIASAGTRAAPWLIGKTRHLDHCFSSARCTAKDPKQLDKILAETRKRGYATRDPGFVGGDYVRAPFDDGLAAIAVALSDGTRVYGAMNIGW